MSSRSTVGSSGLDQDVLTDDEREAVYVLGETLIPEGGSGPSADQAAVASRFIDQFLHLRPDLHADFRTLLAEADLDQPREWCERLERERPDAFSRLTFAIAGAYLLSPKARNWLEYEGQVGEHQDGSPQPEYAEGGLLDQVVARGPIYRPTSWEPNAEGGAA
ncbi:hypothetical protein [Saccharopolyspora oryzae]|uniref:Gluconate 2-dehydrogenase subunit 3 family protein n=1 Tax=Saccharopolyspora oryzae TaxID=2997343 RepID=A0ABT4VA03_9PSEU|nr:hypothetical protein [Saccharopolyspora oryzae]MDA3630784.1 hypothetical protein [Saccharopolyspora oryzae]